MKQTPLFITVFLFSVMSLFICCNYAGETNQPEYFPGAPETPNPPEEDGIGITLPSGNTDDINLILSITDTSAGKKCTATFISGASYKWFIDDELQSGKTSNILKLSFSEISKGYHSVLVVVEKNNSTYTKIDSFNYY